METYKVGGFVRDHLLGIESSDIDYVVIGATPRDMIELGFKPVGMDFPVFLHPNTGDEYALARTEVKRSEGYHGFKCKTNNISLGEDLYRRDLTINAMAMDNNGNIIDPYAGEEDLNNKILRHISSHFIEDPLRVLRIARFYAKFPDFTVADETKVLLMKIVESGELKLLTPERIQLELVKVLKTNKPSNFFKLLKEVGALEDIFVEIHNLIGVPQTEKYHPEGDVFEHTMLVLDACRKITEDYDTLISALTHDFGKALTPEDILPGHHGHEDVGVSIVKKFCIRLRIPSSTKKLAMYTCKYHTYGHRCLEMRPKKLLDMLTSTRWLQHEKQLLRFINVCRADEIGKLKADEYMQGRFLIEVRNTLIELNTKELQEKYQGIPLRDAIVESRVKALKVLKTKFNA